VILTWVFVNQPLGQATVAALMFFSLTALEALWAIFVHVTQEARITELPRVLRLAATDRDVLEASEAPET